MKTRTIQDIDDLRVAYYDAYPDGHFFDHDTLKFFGERYSEMRLLKDTVVIEDSLGAKHECYVVSSRQRPPMGQPRRVHHYFDVNTMDNVNMA